MSLAGTAIKRPLGTLLVSLAVMVVGVMGFREMRLGLMPQIVYPLIKVRVQSPGTPPDVMELTVTRPLEQELARTEGAVLVQSTTEQGMTDITLSFNFGTDVDMALRDANTRLDFAKGRLPAGVLQPLIWKLDPADSPVLQAVLGSDTTGEVELRRWAEYDLGPQLTGVPGVAAVQVAGGQEREIQVNVDLGRLAGYDLSLAGVADALKNENRQEAAGRVDQGRIEWLTRTTANFPTVEAIEKVNLPLPGGRVIQLDDIAQVRDTVKDQRLFVRSNGQPAVLVSIFQNPSANTVETVDALQVRLRQLRDQGFLPADFQLEIVGDESYYIRSTVHSLQEHLLVGTVLAVVVLLVFLGDLRATFCVVAVFPMAILGTLAVLRYGGLTLNLMSLGGIIVGLGVMIDSAIVVMENIDRRRRDGLEAGAAGEKAAGEVTGSLVAATLAMLVSVFPFLAIASLALLFYREMIVTIAVSFVLALLASLTVVPALAGVIYRRPARPSRFWDATGRAYGSFLGACLRLSPVAAVGVVVAGVAGVLLFGRMGNIFLPEVDDGRVEVRVMMPPGRSLAENVEATKTVEGLIREMPDVRTVMATIGGRISTAVSYDSSQSEIAVQLVPRSERKQGVAQWVEAMRARMSKAPIPEVRQVRIDKARNRSIRTFQGGAGREGVTDLQLNIQGQDPTALNEAATLVLEAIRDVPGLEGVRSTAPPPRTELSFDLDATRAAALGIDAESVAKHLKIAIAGETPTRFLDLPFFYDVRLWADRGQLEGDAENLQIIKVPAADGRLVPLASVAEINRRPVPLYVERENQSPLVKITGGVSGDRTLGAVIADIRGRLDRVELPKGVRYQFGGEAATLAESQAPMVGALLLALFLRLIVLGVQFESLLNPFLVMLTVLPAMVGSLVALDLAGIPISSTVYVGLLLAAGIVESNSIIMVEFIEHGRKEGLGLHQAILDAAPHRLRPILMTVLVGVAALAPLALGTGDGSELLQPMALAVVGGLVVATLFTLVFLPCFYLMAHGIKGKIARLISGPGRSPGTDRRDGRLRPERVATSAMALLLPFTLCACATATRRDVPPQPGIARQAAPTYNVPPAGPNRDDGVKKVTETSTAAEIRSTAGAPGEIKSELTVEEALDYALTYHPSLRVRQHEVEMARGQLVTAGLLPNPSLVLDQFTTLVEDETGTLPTNITGRVVFTIPTAGKVRRRIAVAQVGIDRAALRLGQETLLVLTEAAGAAVELLSLQERLALQDQFRELADSVLRVQRARFEQGDISERELLIAQLDAAQIESDRLDLLNQLEVARVRLNRSIGSTQPRPLRVIGQPGPDAVKVVPLETLLAVARQVRPELAESRAGIVQSQRELALAESLAVPDIGIGPRYRESFNKPDDQVGARLNLDLPIFDRNQGNIAQSVAQIHRARAFLAATELTSLNDVASIYTQITALQRQLKFLDEAVLPLSTRAEAAIRSAYEAGDIEAVELSAQLTKLLQIRQTQLTLRFLNYQLRTRLELFLGLRLNEMAPAG